MCNASPREKLHRSLQTFPDSLLDKGRQLLLRKMAAVSLCEESLER